jgi:hypothetical protein
MWDRVVKAMLDAVAADERLAAIYGERVRAAADGKKIEPPLLEWVLIGDGVGEQWSPVTIQLDQWVKTADELRASEARLHHLFSRDMTASYGGLTMFAGYAGGDTLALPNRDGYYGRAVRFRLTPLRRQYAPTP